jgi:protein-tyrosine phosphatase
MHEVEPNRLWVGNADDARNPQPIFDNQISVVIDVAFEEKPATLPQKPATLPRQLIYCRFPLNDGGGNDPATLQLAMQCVVDCLRHEMTVLVACSAGLSRSPVIAAMALAHFDNITPEAAIGRIAQTKTLEVNGVLWSDAVKLFPLLRGAK